MFNRRERIALSCLCASLLIGILTHWLAVWRPEQLPDFRIQRAVAEVVPIAASAELVDLNSASVEELQRLPGIGEKTAARIVEYRQQSGAFSALQDLRQVRGIGAATLEKIAPFLRVP